VLTQKLEEFEMDREIRHANVRRPPPQRGSGKSAFSRSSSGRTTNSSNFF